LHGKIRLRPGSRLSGTVAGTLYPASAYAVLRQTFRLPRINFLNKFSCAGSPIRAEVEIPEFVLHSRQWKISGKLSGKDIRYDQLVLAAAHSGFSVSPTRLMFTNIEARTEKDVELGLNIGIRFDPLQVRIDKGRIVGDPRVATSFVEPQAARKIYSRIWRDFTWDAKTPPRVTLPSLIYKGGSADWRLTMDASLAVENVRYKNMQAEKISLAVKLNLPAELRIEKATVRTADGLAHGNMRIRFSGTPKCEFSFSNAEGGADPKRILQLFREDWGRYFDDVEFAPKSNISCHGSFFLKGDPVMRIQGTLKTPFAAYKGLRIEELETTWGVTPESIGWDLRRGRVFGGEIRSTGTYDITNRIGQVALNCRRMSFPDVLTHFGNKKDHPSLPGFLWLDCKLQVLRNWAGKDLQLTGNGRLSITDSDLWNLGMLKGLGSLLNARLLHRLSLGRLSTLGKISRLDADLSFHGNRLLIPSLSTDGTILSLRGSGEYSWESDRFFFQVTGQTLHKVRLLSFALRPLSWVFKAEVVGSPEKHKWRMVNVFKQVLSAGENKEFPSLDDSFQ
jgi:hypothetical protein